MNRFFLSRDLFASEVIRFPVDVSAQISRVLRLKEGERVIILDGEQHEALVELTMVSPRETLGTVLERSESKGEPFIQLTLLVGLTQREKFEWILQKGTELGVSEFHPLITARSLVQKGDDLKNKLDRWQRIIKEAAEQSARGRIPSLAVPQKLENAVHKFASDTLKIVLWEEEQQSNLKDLLQGHPASKNIVVLIGPEGGLTQPEVEQAIQTGFVSASLGTRILRMETAAITAAALVMYEYGEMENHLK